MNRFELLCLLFLFSLLAGCDKDPIDFDLQSDGWQRDSLKSITQLINAAVTEGEFNVHGINKYYKNIAADKPIGTTSSFTLRSNSVIPKFPVLKNLVVAQNQGQVYIKTVATTEADSKELVILIKDYDQDFLESISIPYWQGHCLGATETGVILIPYLAAQNGVMINTPRFLEIQIDMNKVSENQIEQKSARVLRYDQLFPGSVTVREVYSLQNYFLLIMGNSTFRYDPSIGLEQVLNYPVTVAARKDSLIGFYANPNTQQTECFSSLNQAKSWKYLGSIPTNLSDLNYTVVNDSLIGYAKSQIFTVQFKKGNKYGVRELNNNGLPLADITSLSLVNNTHVAITNMPNSFSIKSGLYYKPVKSFFESKQK